MQQAPTPAPVELGRLIEAVANTRDRDAFASLFDYFAPRLKAYLMRAGASPSVAEDFAQETMLLVWHKASLYDPSRAGASAWIYTIARNLRTDALRRRFDIPLDSSAETDGPASPEKLLIERDEAERIREILGELPEDQARIIHLSFYSEKPHEEIARDLGLPLGTVKSRLRRTMLRLRNVLADRR